MRQWFEHLDDESDPDHIRTGVAFATVPQSGNYFVMPVEGPNAGKVFYADHDGWYESHFAKHFSEFITRVTNSPAHLLSEELGCYSRYSDGKTPIQWIPESEGEQNDARAGAAQRLHSLSLNTRVADRRSPILSSESQKSRDRERWSGDVRFRYGTT